MNYGMHRMFEESSCDGNKNTAILRAAFSSFQLSPGIMHFFHSLFKGDQVFSLALFGTSSCYSVLQHVVFEI